MSKFEEGSLAAMVAGGGLDKLREAGDQATNGKVLSLYYAQNVAPEGWVPAGTIPDTTLAAGELAQWFEDLAYKTWLALPVCDRLYSFVPAGVCRLFVLKAYKDGAHREHWYARRVFTLALVRANPSP